MFSPPAPPSPRRAARALLALLAIVLGALMIAPPPAHAQSADDGVSIRVQVKDQRRDASGKAANEPVAGVHVQVFDASDNLVGEGDTDEDGRVDIVVGAKADYRVVLDEGTLPEGMALAANTPAEVLLDGESSFVTLRKTVNFFTGESQRVQQAQFDRWAQRVIDGLRLGMIIALCSVGLSLIFGTTGLTNFAHGEMVTFGAMVAWWVNGRGVHVAWAALIAVASGGALGYALDRWGFDKLRARGVSLIPQMIITIGASITAKNFFLARFGGVPMPYFNYSNQVGRKIGPITITPRDLVVTILAFTVVVAVALTLQYTQLGKAARAVSDNRDLAGATGINTTLIVRLIWIAAGALTALAGVFRGLDESVDWNMGGGLLFLMFSAITLGGLGSAYGALLGGLLVGLMVELSTMFGVPSELKVVPALVLMIVMLLVRPQGLLGRAQRVG